MSERNADNIRKPFKLGLILSGVIFLAGLVLTVAGYLTKSGPEVTKENMLVIYGLVLLLAGCVALLSCLFQKLASPVIQPSRSMSSERVKLLAQAALFAALSYIGFQYFRIDIPVGPEKTAFHLGNTFVVLAALLLGGTWGGMSGALGLTLADLTSAYVTSAPKTFFLKLCIGLITGLVAHQLLHLSTEQNSKKVVRNVILASACGLAFNIIADPLVGYFYKSYLLGIPQDLSATLAKFNLLTTSVNALTSTAAASLIYLALRPALIKAGLFKRFHQ